MAAKRVAAVKRLSANRHALLASVQWATRPMFARGMSTRGGRAAARCVIRLAAARPSKLAASGIPKTAAKQMSLDGSFRTPARPFKLAQLSGISRSMSAVGARRMSAEVDADAAPPAAAPAAVVPGPIAAVPAVDLVHTCASPEDAIYHGDFAAALQMAQSDPASGSLVPGLKLFVEAGKLIRRNQFSAARFYLRKASGPRVQRLGEWWACKMYRNENRSREADECFAKAGLSEDTQP